MAGTAVVVAGTAVVVAGTAVVVAGTVGTTSVVAATCDVVDVTAVSELLPQAADKSKPNQTTAGFTRQYAYLVGAEGLEPPTPSL